MKKLLLLLILSTGFLAACTDSTRVRTFKIVYYNGDVETKNIKVDYISLYNGCLGIDGEIRYCSVRSFEEIK